MEELRFSPLFWPVKLKKGIIYVLDETLLPDKTEYLRIKTHKDACRAIKEMKTRAVGQVLLVFYTFLLTVQKNRTRKNLISILNKVAQELNGTRQTLPFKFLTDMVLSWAKKDAPLEESIEGFLQRLRNGRIKQARVAARLIKNGEVILTHCNVSGILPLIGEFCRLENKTVSFFTTETRPYLQGSRLTAWELEEAGFDTTVITDNAAAYVMHSGMIDKIIVGADQLARNGDIANKIGTYQLALLARHFRLPFYVLCPPASAAETGSDIKIEIRPDEEMFKIRNIRLAAKGAKGYYPAFDITPNNLITRHITLEI